MLRGTIQTIPIDKLKPNPWNPNQQSDLVFEKEKSSIQTIGFVTVPIVRESPGGFEILDGEHRWKAISEIGGKDITVNNLGTVDDAEAKLITELLNSLKGINDPIRHQAMLAEMLEQMPEYRDLLPYTPEHLESLLNPSFDWDSLSTKDPSDKAPAESFGAVLNVKMSEEQLEVCQRAIAAAKDTGDCETDARAMELICAEFLSGR